MSTPIANLAALDVPSPAAKRTVFAVSLTIIASALTALTLASGLLTATSVPAGDAGAPFTRMHLAVSASCGQCGTIEAIQPTEAARLGAATGAVVGGQLGGEQGAMLLSVLGVAAGGGLKASVNSASGWAITVRMEDGSLRSVGQKQTPSLTIGDRVRLVRGGIVART